jgi:hypothetical protein
MFTYTNRRGVAYYVHEVRTKPGARRYVVNRTVAGALADLPAGMEIAENVNGQVSVRAARERAILPLEERLVQEALVKHGREKYRVEVKGRDIVVHEPDFDADGVAESMHPMNAWGVLGPTLEKLMRKRLEHATDRLFAVERMTYRGEGGWLWLKGNMPLAAACQEYVPLLGTDELFEEF